MQISIRVDMEYQPESVSLQLLVDLLTVFQTPHPLGEPELGNYTVQLGPTNLSSEAMQFR